MTSRQTISNRSGIPFNVILKNVEKWTDKHTNALKSLTLKKGRKSRKSRKKKLPKDKK